MQIEAASPWNFDAQVVSKNKAYLYPEPGAQGRAELVMDQYVRMNVIKNNTVKGWVQVRMPHHKIGWVMKKDLIFVTPQNLNPKAYRYLVNEQGLDYVQRRSMAIFKKVYLLKEQPRKDAPAKARLSARLQVELLDYKGRWFQVKTPQGRVGWVEGTAIRVSKSGFEKLRLAKRGPLKNRLVAAAQKKKELPREDDSNYFVELDDQVDNENLAFLRSPQSESDTVDSIEELSQDAEDINTETEGAAYSAPLASEELKNSLWKLGGNLSLSVQSSHENTVGFSGALTLLRKWKAPWSFGGLFSVARFSEESENSVVRVERVATPVFIGPLVEYDFYNLTDLNLRAQLALGLSYYLTDLSYTDPSTGASLSSPGGGIPKAGSHKEMGVGIHLNVGYDFLVNTKWAWGLEASLQQAFHEDSGGISGQVQPQHLSIGLSGRYQF